MLTRDSVTKAIRDDPRVLGMVITCALNDPRIFAKLQELVVKWYAARNEIEVNECKGAGLALADLINNHVEGHISDALHLSQSLELLLTPAPSNNAH